MKEEEFRSKLLLVEEAIKEDILKIMCCIQHSDNTIDKMQFAKDELKVDLTMDENLINILEKILKLN